MEWRHGGQLTYQYYKSSTDQRNIVDFGLSILSSYTNGIVNGRVPDIVTHYAYMYTRQSSGGLSSMISYSIRTCSTCTHHASRASWINGQTGYDLPYDFSEFVLVIESKVKRDNFWHEIRHCTCRLLAVGSLARE